MDVLELEMKQTTPDAFFYGVHGTPFTDAAEAWWWTLDCLEARAGGSRGCSALKLGRPCEPDDVVNALRRLDLPKVHARTVMAWGNRRTKPPEDSDALRLWNEVMARLTMVLQAKGIVRTPAPPTFELVDLLATGLGFPDEQAANPPCPQPRRRHDRRHWRFSAFGDQPGSLPRRQNRRQSAWPVTRRAGSRSKGGFNGTLTVRMPLRPPVHQPAHGGAAKQRLAFDRWRGSAASRGYDGAWKALRLAKLKADPLCWWCQCEGRLTAANTVDHIVPIAERPELRLVWSNLRSGCKPCHDAHTAHQVAAGHRRMRGTRLILS